MTRKPLYAILLMGLLLISYPLISSVLGLQSSQSILSYGTVRYKNVLIEWWASHRNLWPITNPDYAINISRFIGATGVLLVFFLEEDLRENFGDVRSYVSKYREAGFFVYPCIASDTLFGSGDIQGLLKLDITGVVLDLMGTFNTSDIEAMLIELGQTCREAGKKFAYYHGDACINVNATKLSNEGLIVWSTWDPPNGWAPKTWEFPTIWTQCDVWNRDGKYSTYDDILYWYESLPRKREGIVFWQTTNNHQPTEEQVQAMRNVSSSYKSYVSPPPSPYIFEDGFEGGISYGFGAWIATGGGTVTTTGETATVVATDSYRGTYSAKFSCDGSSSGEEAYAYTIFTPQSIIYTRIYIKFKTDLPSPGCYYRILDHYAESDWVSLVYIENVGGAIKWEIGYHNGTSHHWIYTGTNAPVLDQWYCVELYTKIDATAGATTLYINGSAVLTETGLNTTAHGKINKLCVGENYANGQQTHDIYIDCVVVSDAYIGPEK